MTEVKTFRVEVKVHLLNIDAIDIDNIVAKNEVQDLFDNYSPRNEAILSSGEVVGVKEEADKE